MHTMAGPIPRYSNLASHRAMTTGRILIDLLETRFFTPRTDAGAVASAA